MNLHPLVQRLVGRPGVQALALDALEAWAARRGDHVLFLGGDPVRFPEALDVAVVLPELIDAFAGRFDVGVVGREDEDAAARRFGSQRWPALVFLRDGQYVGVVAGMKDWPDYLEAVAGLLDAPVSRPPTVGIPVVASGGASGAGCH